MGTRAGPRSAYRVMELAQPLRTADGATRFRWPSGRGRWRPARARAPATAEPRPSPIRLDRLSPRRRADAKRRRLQLEPSPLRRPCTAAPLESPPRLAVRLAHGNRGHRGLIRPGENVLDSAPTR